MKKNKKVKKARKKEKKTRALVKETFNSERIKNNPIVESLVKSVLLNKRLLKNDKNKQKEWQDDYYQELFSKFKEMVNDHNKIFQFKNDELINKVEQKKSELKKLKEELKEIKIEKKIVEHA